MIELQNKNKLELKIIESEIVVSKMRNYVTCKIKL